MNGRRVARYVLRETLGLVVMGVALFWAAGRVDWWPGWAALAVMLGWILATGILVVRVNPGWLAERLGPQKGAKRWDVVIMSLLGLAQLVRYIVAGLDARYHWTTGVPVAAQAGALMVCVAGYAMVVWAMATNLFFSQIVRIQTERGHTVVTGGPYQYVRHPGYVGAILYELAVPILLASRWAMLASGVSVGLLVVRTALEDRMLQAELAGYREYALRVRDRLLPGVW
jgi:protein-S-isoprenylcysteine O-methyltransferase Ste14